MKDINLFPAQIKLLKSEEQIILLLASRGYGKSYSVAYWCIKKLLTDSYRGILVNATYQQLRETVKYVLEHLETLNIEYALNTRPTFCKSLLSDHKNIISINLNDNKHRYIKCLSMDNPESIRGSSADFLAIDEAALADEDFIDTARPVLRGHPLGSQFKYQTLLATTPTTVSNWIYRRFIEKNIPNFIEIKAKAEENFIEYNKEKLDFLKDSMTELMFSREYNLQWISFNSNSMAYAFSDSHIKSLEDKERGRLFLSCDINNLDLQSSCGWFSKDFLHIDNEILIPEGGNPEKIANEFHKKYSHLKIRQVSIFGDRYGSNKSTTSKETYYEQLFKYLKSLRWSYNDYTLKQNPSVWDSNEIFMKLCEKNQFSIDPVCKEIIRHLKTVQWKKNEHIMDKNFLDSGFYDSIRYVCWDYFRPSTTITSINNFF